MVQRITKAATKPTANARIKIVSGPDNPSNTSDTRAVSKTTGYFGKTIAEIE